MATPQDYFMSLLQVYGSVNDAGTRRAVNALILEHLEALKATVDYTATDVADADGEE